MMSLFLVSYIEVIEEIQLVFCYSCFAEFGDAAVVLFFGELGRLYSFVTIGLAGKLVGFLMRPPLYHC